jgi:propionyl-CoA synthetase
MKPGSACKPVPGYDVRIIAETGEEVKVSQIYYNLFEKDDKLGRVCLKLPTPPSFASTLWKND